MLAYNLRLSWNVTDLVCRSTVCTDSHLPSLVMRRESTPRLLRSEAKALRKVSGLHRSPVFASSLLSMVEMPDALISHVLPRMTCPP